MSGAYSSLVIWIQILAGVLPSLFLTLGAWFGITASMTIGVPVAGTKELFVALGATLGTIGLATGTICLRTSPVLVAPLVVAGFTAMGIQIGPAVTASGGNLAVFGLLGMLLWGPILVGTYQLTMALKLLIPFKWPA